MSDFADFWLETARIQANSQRMFPMEKDEAMAAYEKDLDRAEQVSEPCEDCNQPIQELCHLCSRGFCERHLATHECATRQIVDGMDARNREYLEGKR